MVYESSLASPNNKSVCIIWRLNIENLKRHSHKFRRIKKKHRNNMKLDCYKNVCWWICFVLFDCFTLNLFIRWKSDIKWFLHQPISMIWFVSWTENINLRRFHAAWGNGTLDVRHYFIGTNEKTFRIENVCHVSQDTVDPLRNTYCLWTKTLFFPFSFALIGQTRGLDTISNSTYH